MINPPVSSPQIAASGSFLLGNTGQRSGSNLIGQGYHLHFPGKYATLRSFKYSG
jgi:hypothetical protein